MNQDLDYFKKECDNQADTIQQQQQEIEFLKEKIKRIQNQNTNGFKGLEEQLERLQTQPEISLEECKGCKDRQKDIEKLANEVSRLKAIQQFNPLQSESNIFTSQNNNNNNILFQQPLPLQQQQQFQSQLSQQQQQPVINNNNNNFQSDFPLNAEEMRRVEMYLSRNGIKGLTVTEENFIQILYLCIVLF